MSPDPDMEHILQGHYWGQNGIGIMFVLEASFLF